MVPSAKTCHRLLLFPTACMFVLFLLWIAQTDIDEKESRLSVIISRLKRPVDIFVFNNEGNQTLSAVDITPYMWTENATQKQTYASRNTSNGSIYGDRYSTTEAVYTESVQDDGVDEDFLREREKVFSERRQRIEKVCQQMGPVVTYGSVENTPLSRLRWLNARSLIMCFNAKVGTSSWSQYLLDVAKPGLVSTLKNIHSAAARLLVPPFGHSSPMFLMLLNNYKKIMIVRHPFARVVSAYLDKIVGGEFWKTTSRRSIVVFKTFTGCPSTPTVPLVISITMSFLTWKPLRTTRGTLIISSVWA
ncbi:hypothetical protein O3P69_008091 [Scylla paramamosain]|uniref:Carbohydrate sulfotransferase n=1 Tax=Scylla paramamosain TaxID=85552 RepID=A0AAW0T0Z5_SCYPA